MSRSHLKAKKKWNELSAMTVTLFLNSTFVGWCRWSCSGTSPARCHGTPAKISHKPRLIHIKFDNQLFGQLLHLLDFTLKRSLLISSEWILATPLMAWDPTIARAAMLTYNEKMFEQNGNNHVCLFLNIFLYSLPFFLLVPRWWIELPSSQTDRASPRTF